MSSASYLTQRQKALKYIMEFLTEENLTRTLEALVEECETDFENEQMYKLKVPFNAMHSAIDLYETVQASESTRDVRSEMNRFDALLSSTSAPPQAMVESISVTETNTHTQNVLNAVTVPTKPTWVITASVSRDIVITDVESKTVVCKLDSVLNAVAISIDIKHYPTSGDWTVLAGLMNGEVVVLTLRVVDDVASLSVSQSFKSHSKYVVGVKWAKDGFGFVSVSHDTHMCFFKPVGSDATAVTYEQTGKLTFKGQIECVVALSKDTASSDSSQTMSNILDKNVKDSQDPSHRFRQGINDLVEFTQVAHRAFVVGVRGDHLLHIVDLDSMSETDTINMNSIGDDYVSFVPLSMDVSAKGNLLLVCTDMHRIILFDIYTKHQIRNYYGGKNDGLSNPIVRWGGMSGMEHVLCTTQDNEIYIWNAHTQKVDKILKGHTKAIRGMTTTLGNTIITTGFDRTIKLWK